MGFSNIAAQQREKAAETLKSFLALGLIGSVGLHIAILGFGIGNFLDKVPPLKDEPMELTLIEPPTLEEKPVAETQEKSPPSASRNETPKVVSAPSSIAIAPSSPSVVTQKPPKPLTNIPKKQVVENSKTPLPQQKLIQTPKEITKPQPAPVAKITAPAKVPTAPEVVAASPTVPSSVTPRSPNNQKLRDLLATTRNTDQKPNNISASSQPNALGLRQPSNTNNLPIQSGNWVVNSTNSGSRVTGNAPSGNSTGNSTVGTSRANSSASGSRTGIGNKPSSSTNSGSRIGTNNRSGSNVATEAQNVRSRNAQPESSSNANASSGSLACRTCSKPKYPAKARRRGLEGKTEINVDVDGKGNVTKVRLARSSGHSELDKAALEEARRWKFKAPSGGKRSVSAKVDFAIEGSERSRKLRERRKRRPAQSRRAPIENARSNPATETTNTPTPTRRIRQRQQNSSPSPRRPQTAATRRVDTLPPRRAEDAALPRRRARASRRSPQPALITNQRALGQSLRRQRQSSNQTKLRQSLRQLQQSQLTDNPND
ncbi:energy transducer TonB [Synechocystis sp. PCC 7509]|uniref:energy transducer TonB n=1 Tax=Synechocystis sp. PCC 7509 TaxID=927677 RepID=UPI0002AC36A8|nr:energy transducer TonB [Synechocystis sp. PCC 7509]